MFFKKQELDVKVNIHKIDLQFTERDLKLYYRIIDDVTEQMLKKVHKQYNETQQQYEDRLQEAIMMSVTSKRYQFVDFPQIVYPNEYPSDYISPKAQWLLDNLPKFDGKTIIFDSRTMTTDLLCDILRKNNIKYYIVDGKISLKDRNIILDRFRNEDDVRILICSDCLSYGVNLRESKRIINLNLLYNPSAMTQRQGRILRKGQNQDVDIYFMEMKDTFEEKIYEKLDYRSQVASNIFDEDFLKKRKRQVSKNKMIQMICEKGKSK
jgi:SNF2 family DNA or RNA helicase